MELRQMGRFTIGRDWIMDGLGKVIYRDLVPLDVRFRLDSCTFEVLAAGECFDLVPEGREAPWYDIQFQRDSMDIVEVRFVRRVKEGSSHD